MLDTWAPKSIKAVTSCPSITTGASLEHPTNCAIGSGFKNGVGVTSGCPLFWLPSLGSVLVWGQEGDVASLLVAAGGGLTAFLGSPHPC